MGTVELIKVTQYQKLHNKQYQNLHKQKTHLDHKGNQESLAVPHTLILKWCTLVSGGCEVAQALSKNNNHDPRD